MDSPAISVSRRLARARDRVAELALDGLLIGHTPNVRYLTAFSGSNGWLLLAPDRAVFFTDGRYEEQAADELANDVGLELCVSRDGTLLAVMERAVADFASATVGFESNHLRFADFERLEAEAGAIDWVPAEGVVENLRMIKEEGEIEAMRRASEITAAALEETLGELRPGMQELEVAAELDYRMRRLGADGPAFETIVASGPRSALPHASPGERRLEIGDLVLCDVGARWRGYCADLTRTFVLGDPSARQTEVHEIVIAAKRAACAALKGGVTGARVDAAAREVFAERDVESNFAHSTGHGLGLEVHEGPRLHRRGEDELQPGMVVTVEPGLYFAGWGGIRIEDDFVVSEGAPGPLLPPSGDGLRSLPV